MKHNYLRILTMLVLLFIAVSGNSQIIADGTYQIYNEVNKQVMTSATADPFDASMADQDATDSYQLWDFTHQGDDVYKITNNATGNTLGIKDGWCGVFGDVQAKFSDSDTNTLFKIQSGALADNFTLTIAFTACNFGSVNDPIKAFDIENGAIGGQIQTYDVDSSNPNQQFRIIVPGSLSVDLKTNKNNIAVLYNKESKQLQVKSLITVVDNIELLNLSGKLIMTSTNIEQADTISFDTSMYAKGIYFLRLKSANQQVIKKIVLH